MVDSTSALKMEAVNSGPLRLTHSPAFQGTCPFVSAGDVQIPCENFPVGMVSHAKACTRLVAWSNRILAKDWISSHGSNELAQLPGAFRIMALHSVFQMLTGRQGFWVL